MTGTDKFLGERLEAGGDLGQFLHAVLALLGGAREKLEVVDDEHVEPVLALQAPGARGELGDRDAAGLVDVERDRCISRAASAILSKSSSRMSPRRIL